MKISLNDLPEHHPYRNIKLKDLEVFYRKEGTKAWQEVFSTYNIAKNTYNELVKCGRMDRSGLWIVIHLCVRYVVRN